MIAVGARSREVPLNAQLAQNGFGTSCKRGTRYTYKSANAFWYVRRNERCTLPTSCRENTFTFSRKYVRSSFARFYTALTLSCIFKVHWCEYNVSYICNRLMCNDAWKKLQLAMCTFGKLRPICTNDMYLAYINSIHDKLLSEIMKT
jgi:hypothetical protein